MTGQQASITPAVFPSAERWGRCGEAAACLSVVIVEQWKCQGLLGFACAPAPIRCRPSHDLCSQALQMIHVVLVFHTLSQHSSEIGYDIDSCNPGFTFALQSDDHHHLITIKRVIWKVEVYSLLCRESGFWQSKFRFHWYSMNYYDLFFWSFQWVMTHCWWLMMKMMGKKRWNLVGER